MTLFQLKVLLTRIHPLSDEWPRSRMRGKPWSRLPVVETVLPALLSPHAALLEILRGKFWSTSTGVLSQRVTLMSDDPTRSSLPTSIEWLHRKWRPPHNAIRLYGGYVCPPRHQMPCSAHRSDDLRSTFINGLLRGLLVVSMSPG